MTLENDPSAAWSAHADAYARTFAPLTGHLARGLFALAAARLPTPARVLDVACGGGELSAAAVNHLARVAAATGQQGEVVAMDFSPAMVELTSKAIAGAPFARCLVGNGEDLGLPAAHFDAVFSAFGIFLFRDRHAGWREAARVLKSGGLLATTVWRGPEFNGMARLQRELMELALPERLKTYLTAPDWLPLTTAEGLEAEITSAAPFVRASVSVLNATLVIPNAQQLWQAMRQNPVSAGLLRAFTPPEMEHAEQVILDRLATLFGGPDRPIVFDTSCHALVAERA